MGKKELVALLNLSPWCLVMVEWLILTIPWRCLQFVIVVFPDHSHLLFFCVWSLFCYAVLSVLSSFCNHLKEEERVGCFSLIVFVMSCDC